MFSPYIIPKRMVYEPRFSSIFPRPSIHSLPPRQDYESIKFIRAAPASNLGRNRHFGTVEVRFEGKQTRIENHIPARDPKQCGGG